LPYSSYELMTFTAPNLPSTSIKTTVMEVSVMWNHHLMLAVIYLTITLSIGWLFTIAILELL